MNTFQILSLNLIAIVYYTVTGLKPVNDAKNSKGNVNWMSIGLYNENKHKPQWQCSF